MSRKNTATIALALTCLVLSPAVHAQVRWDPISLALVVEGGPAILEVQAVDDSRDHVLQTQFLLLSGSEPEVEAIQVFDAGVLEHEDHAQLRVRLQEGEELYLELLSEEKSRVGAQRGCGEALAAATVTVRKETISVQPQSTCRNAE